MKPWYWIIVALSVLYFLGTQDESQQAEQTVTPSEEWQTPSLVKSDPVEYLFVTGDRVNQRVGPSTTFRKMGQLNRGARVRLLDRNNEWSNIVSSLGNGWISSRYLSRVSPPTKETQKPDPKRLVAVPTSQQIQVARKEIIRQSIASYPGSCPCPYNYDRAGRRCGGRSAWSKPGGYSPLCYESDVSEARVRTYLKRKQGVSY